MRSILSRFLLAVACVTSTLGLAIEREDYYELDRWMDSFSRMNRDTPAFGFAEAQGYKEIVSRRESGKFGIALFLELKAEYGDWWVPIINLTYWQSVRTESMELNGAFLPGFTCMKREQIQQRYAVRLYKLPDPVFPHAPPIDRSLPRRERWDVSVRAESGFRKSFYLHFAENGCVERFEIGYQKWQEHAP